MTKRTFEIFVCVCEEQSMTSAAKNLGLSQPAVSAAIKDLEETYETKLFERQGRSVLPTEAGRRLRQYADIILEQYRNAWDSLHEQEVAETYTAGICPAASETFLPLLAKTVGEQEYPFDVTYISEKPDVLAQMLKDHRIDLCIADWSPEESDLTYLPLYKETYCAAASSSYIKDDVLSIPSLAEKRLLLREEGCGSRECLNAAAQKFSLKLKPHAQCGSDLSLIRMAENGCGIAVVAEDLIERPVRKKRLHEIRIKGTDLRKQYYLVYRSDMLRSTSFSGLCDIIRQCAKKKQKG